MAPSDIPDLAQEEISGQLGLRMGVAAVEQMALKPDGSQLQHPWMADLVSYMNATNGGSSAIHRRYWSLQPTAALAVVDTIRTSLVSLVAELRAAGVTGADTVEAAVADVCGHDSLFVARFEGGYLPLIEQAIANELR